MKTGFIHNITNPISKPIKVKYCDSFLRKLIGLMFRKNIGDYEGILLVDNQESRINTAIHMFFMNFNITAIWINSQFQVNDVKLAYCWHPYYSSQKPAIYVLETHTARFADFHSGDQLRFVYD